jgi:archaellum component FlaC
VESFFLFHPLLNLKPTHLAQLSQPYWQQITVDVRVIMLQRHLKPWETAYRIIGPLSLCLLVSCGAAPESYSNTEIEADVASPAEAGSAPSPGDSAAQLVGDTSPPQAKPQLIKRASLTLSLEDLDAAVDEIGRILSQQQGDVLELRDEGDAPERGISRRVEMQLRVPQANLDPTLRSIKALGDVDYQSVTAEDVSNQLVDLQARIRNLRKSEEALLEIMERSGSVADILAVSQELSAVRETIERAEAQLSNIQNQVAFSTITLTLESTVVPLPNTPPVGSALGQTWQASTQSFRAVTVGLLRLSLWLLVYSPYWAILLGGTFWGYRRWQRHRSIPS